MNKRIITIVIPDLKGNGAERVVLNLAAGFMQNGCVVHIIVFNDFIELTPPDNVKIHAFKQHKRWIPRGIRGKVLAPILDRFILKKCGKPDLVLSNLLPVDRMLVYSKLNVYFIIHSTMSHETKAYKRNMNELAAIYSKKPTIAVSKGAMLDFKNTFANCDFKDSNYIYNPVDTVALNQYSQLPSKLKVVDYIVHIGKFNTAKRHDVLIRAYHKSGVKTPLVLLGQGALLGEIKALVKSLKLSDKVIFAGFYANPYPVIKNAKLMVLSSDFEGLPTVILEAVALNTAVISTNCPSGPSEILPAKNLCPVGDIDKLAELLKKADSEPKYYQQTLGEQFTLDYAVNKYLKLIN